MGELRDKNQKAAQSFLGSFALLVIALVASVIVFYPREGIDDGELTQAVDIAEIEASQKREQMRAPAKIPVQRQEATVADSTDTPSAPPAPVNLDGKGSAEKLDDAIAMIDAGDVNAAIEILQQILDAEPNNEQALIEMAMVQLLDLKDSGKAAEYLERVVTTNPDNRIVLSELVSLYEEEGRIDEGLEYLQKAQASHPDSPELAYGVGQLLMSQGRDREAIAHLEKATASSESSVKVFRDLSDAYAREGEGEKAVGALQSAIAKQREEIEDRVSRGLPTAFAVERENYMKLDLARKLLRQGQVDRAESLWQEVSKAMPSDGSVIALGERIRARKG